MLKIGATLTQVADVEQFVRVHWAGGPNTDEQCYADSRLKMVKSMLMGINFSEDEVFPGDFVKILNQLESELYGVCIIDVNYKRAKLSISCQTNNWSHYKVQ